MNISPRIQQLNSQRIEKTLNENYTTDITIVGWGIAGIMTAYFLLTQTDKKICLVDAFKIAHGATGHNAWQVVGYFEKPFDEIVKIYGSKLALQAQQDIYEAWNLLHEVIKTAEIKTPFSIFNWYAWCKTTKQVLEHLEKKLLRASWGINIDTIMIDETRAKEWNIPPEYEHLYTIVSQQEIQNMLNTDQSDFIAVLSTRKGCVNSALLTQEIADWLIHSFKDRFSLFEYTPIKEINCYQNHMILTTWIYEENENKKPRTDKNPNHIITCKKVILCTNGFENIMIKNHQGKNIDWKFHEMVHGVAWYMSWYLDTPWQSPTAISYFLKPWEGGIESSTHTDIYFYLTRRAYELDNQSHTLICIWWPETGIEDKTSYDKNHPYGIHHHQKIDTFLHTTYKNTPEKVNYNFKRHGLMGYTSNGLRCIGPEPYNTNLLYNLGCNGVGILPSIFWGRKIAQFILWNVKTKSIFDPIYQ